MTLFSKQITDVSNDWKNDMIRKSLSKEQAIQKLKHYCGWQERCHQDVTSKLYQLGVRKLQHDEIIANLIEENYLNEERFAKSFARGHFRMKQWGRVKIKYELKLRKISDYCIRQALKEIDETEYENTLKKLIEKNKSFEYLCAKGYEQPLIYKNLTLRGPSTKSEETGKGKVT
jgi:regulatory protein